MDKGLIVEIINNNSIEKVQDEESSYNNEQTEEKGPSSLAISFSNDSCTILIYSPPHYIQPTFC